MHTGATRGIVLLAAALGLCPFAASTYASGDRALGEYLSAECVTCHQITGTYAGIPPIVGWPEAAFIGIMGEYRTKKRANVVMQTIAQRLNDEEVAALAAYFGSLQPLRAP